MQFQFGFKRNWCWFLLLIQHLAEACNFACCRKQEESFNFNYLGCICTNNTHKVHATPVYLLHTSFLLFSFSLLFWECICLTYAHLSPTPIGMHWFVIARSLVITGLDTLVYCRVVPGLIGCLLFCYYSAKPHSPILPVRYLSHKRTNHHNIFILKWQHKNWLGVCKQFERECGKRGFGPWKCQPPCPAWLLGVVAIFIVGLEYKAPSAARAAWPFALFGCRSPSTAYSSGKLLAGAGENHWSLLAVQTLAIVVVS